MMPGARDFSGQISERRLIMIGGGGHCKSVLDSVMSQGKYSDIVVTDPDLPVGKIICGCKVVGGDEILTALHQNGYDNAFIGVGSIKNTSVRRRICRVAEEEGFLFPVLIDNSAVIAQDVDIGSGTFVGKMTVINSGTKVAKQCIINTGAVIDHDCKIGEFTHIAVGAVVCGGCEIGNDVLVGANATVIQGVKIGMNSIIGAGSVVLADVPENTTVYGVGGGQSLGYKPVRISCVHIFDMNRRYAA